MKGFFSGIWTILGLFSLWIIYDIFSINWIHVIEFVVVAFILVCIIDHHRDKKFNEKY